MDRKAIVCKEDVAPLKKKNETVGVVETVAAVETVAETVAAVATVEIVEIVETVAEKMEVGQVRQVAISDQNHRTMIAMNQCVVILYCRLYYLF